MVTVVVGGGGGDLGFFGIGDCHYTYMFWGTLARVCYSIKNHILLNNGEWTSYRTQLFSGGFLDNIRI